MAVVYRWVEHTSEFELSIEARDLERVFSEALAALAELLGDAEGGQASTHRVSAAARDLPGLLVEWLNELVYLAETEGLVPERVERIEVANNAVEAVVAGRLGEPPSLVKGVTYHRLELRRDDGVWHARVVLDV